jgi:hypothetical protein
MTLFALYLLALLDGLLCGARVSMGRCALIRKRRYYLRNALYGLIGAQAISTIALLALLLAVRFSGNRGELRADLEAAAGRMLWIFAPYAIAVVGSMAPRMIPSTDLRSATSVFALGPLSAIRSLVMIVGVVYGAAPSRLAETKLLGAFVLLLMLSLEIVLNFLAARAQARQIGDLLSERPT